MKYDIGTDLFDERARKLYPDAIPPHVELLESFFDIVLDVRQTQHYVELFRERFNQSWKPKWLKT